MIYIRTSRFTKLPYVTFLGIRYLLGNLVFRLQRKNILSIFEAHILNFMSKDRLIVPNQPEYIYDLHREYSFSSWIIVSYQKVILTTLFYAADLSF